MKTDKEANIHTPKTVSARLNSTSKRQLTEPENLSIPPVYGVHNIPREIFLTVIILI